ncbi:polycomb group RING finger protein 1-like [Diadema antillarum]|uniref:polycomb group RING finger protein 1-like n=1 Tax=Diadema antillarum TaxID=105358 RepID=UPI003A891635
MPTIRRCVVGGCMKSTITNPDLSFFSFPKDVKIRNEWIRFVKMTRKDFKKNSDWQYICSRHFTYDCKREVTVYNRGKYRKKCILRTGSLPTLKAPTKLVNVPSGKVRGVGHKLLVGKKCKSDIQSKCTQSVAMRKRSLGTSSNSTITESINTSNDNVKSSSSLHSISPRKQTPQKVQPKMTKREHPPCIYIRLTDVNQYIICHLCGGYLVDATTITECLHTFCKSCLIPYIKKHELCPTCDILIHPSNPFLSIKLDRTMQDIVYKLLPYIQEDELARQRRFWKERNLEAPQQEAAVVEPVSPMSAEPHIAIVLEYAGAAVGCSDIKPLDRKFILVPSRVTVRQIQRFISLKLQLKSSLEVDIVCDEEILEPEVSLKRIWAQSTEDQMANGMLCLYYSVTRSQPDVV